MISDATVGAANSSPKKPKKKMELTTKILFAMCIALVLGSVINAYASDVEFIQTYFVNGIFYMFGKMFIEALKMLVVPLVFCSLIGGVVGMDDMKTLGRTGGKAFLLFMMTTVLAISMGLFIAITAGIGEGMEKGLALATSFTAKEAPGFADVMINIVPNNIIGALAEGNMLQVIFACLVIGIALANSGKAGHDVADFIAKINEVMMTLVNMVMAAAPYGVFCLMAKTFAEQGIDMIMPMIGYFSAVAGTLIVHTTLTFASLLVIYKLNPLAFIKKIRRVQVFAFSTASSNATIPVTLECAERRFGVHNSIASFVVPLGATINMNGTAIMQGVATVFIANVYGIDLSATDYLTVIGMSVLAAIGTAGIPGVGLIMLAMVFAQVGLPVEGIALIIGVDRLLDMMRSAVNVTGDSVVACIVAKSEGKLDMSVYNDPDAGLFDPTEVSTIGASEGFRDEDEEAALEAEKKQI